ncbi:hypothetical protein KM043_007088 [Ampulex compressa]|nr:hypothetical protein KM043_007088 [Ampulex compressa]
MAVSARKEKEKTSTPSRLCPGAAAGDADDGARADTGCGDGVGAVLVCTKGCARYKNDVYRRTSDDKLEIAKMSMHVRRALEKEDGEASSGVVSHLGAGKTTDRGIGTLWGRERGRRSESAKGGGGRGWWVSRAADIDWRDTSSGSATKEKREKRCLM